MEKGAFKARLPWNPSFQSAVLLRFPVELEPESVWWNAQCGTGSESKFPLRQENSLDALGPVTLSQTTLFHRIVVRMVEEIISVTLSSLEEKRIKNVLNYNKYL